MFFLDFLETSNNYNKWRPLFNVLLGTGMRIGECLGLQWSDCDFDRKIIHVSHNLVYFKTLNGKCEFHMSSTKTSAGERDIPMFESIRKTLLHLKQSQILNNVTSPNVDDYNNFVFINSKGNPHAPAYIDYVINK